MIDSRSSGPRLTPSQRFALDLLLDTSGLLRGAGDGAINVIIDGGTSAIRGPVPLPEQRSVLMSVQMLDRIVAVGAAGVEQETTMRDRHGRVPSNVNPLVVAGQEREPEIGRLAISLRETAVAAAAGAPCWAVSRWPGDATWAAAISHDVDIVTGWPLFTGLRSVELLRRREMGRFGATAASAFGAIGRKPLIEGASWLCARLAERNIRSTWFFLSGTPSLASWRRGDVTYAIDGASVAPILREVVGEGHEIGLHGSLAAGDDAGRMIAERNRLEDAAGVAVTGIRQHFLRMRPGTTQQAMAAAGFCYDATWGFADRNGFRLGIADVVPGWNAAAEETIGIEQVPLTWMDRALSKYGGVEDPEAWGDDAVSLMTPVRETGGCWIGLWHPNLLPALGFPGAPEVLVRILDEMRSGGAWIAPINEMVAWRQWRRGLRAGSDTYDGAPVLRATSPTSGDPAVFLTDLASGARIRATVAASP